MNEKVIFSLVMISLIVLLSSLFAIFFFSYERIQKLDNIKFESKNLLNDWKDIEISTSNLLITNNIKSTIKELDSAMNSFDSRLSNFVNLPKVKQASDNNLEFYNDLKILEKLWELNKKTLNHIKTDLEIYFLNEGINGELLIKFGEQRKTRKYSFEQKQLIDEIKSTTSLSEKSFINALNHLISQVDENIQNQLKRFITIFFSLIFVLILVSFLIVYYFIQKIRTHSKKLSNEIDIRKRIENKLRKKSFDLERFVKVAVGREEKMIELKKKIKEHESK